MGVSLCYGAFLEAGQVDSFLPLSSRCRGPGGINEGWAQLQRRAVTQVKNEGSVPIGLRGETLREGVLVRTPPLPRERAAG